MGAAAIFGLSALNAGIGAMSNAISHNYSVEDMKYAAELNEEAARNADLRTRALYKDFYSPEAILKQYKQAGLSPSLMYGGTPGQGGTSGAQGGTSALNTPYTPISLIEGAQMANIAAQTEKTKAETANIRQDTQNKQAQEIWQNYLNDNKRIEVQMATTQLQGNDGKLYSMYELAENCYDYDKFINIIKDYSRKSNNFELETNIATEAGQKTLREIYMAANRFERDIKVLSHESVNAEFQKNVLETMSKKGFAEQNAETALKQLKAAGETADLTIEQKSAWNNVLERLRKTDSTMADILIVVSMIFNQAASHWK